MLETYPLERLALISAGASVLTIYIVIGFLSFVKVGINNISYKSSAGHSKNALGGFGYNYVVKILSLLVIISTQFYLLIMVSSISNTDNIRTWLRCFGISYAFENALDVIYVIYALIRGPSDKIS